MAGFDLDPFANFPRSSHPALSEHHEFGFEIYEDLFENFFSSDEYQAWSSGQKAWPLHIFGGPGCGKVRLRVETSAYQLSRVTRRRLIDRRELME